MKDLTLQWREHRCWCTVCQHREPAHREVARYTVASRPLEFREIAALGEVILGRGRRHREENPTMTNLTQPAGA